MNNNSGGGPASTCDVWQFRLNPPAYLIMLLERVSVWLLYRYYIYRFVLLFIIIIIFIYYNLVFQVLKSKILIISYFFWSHLTRKKKIVNAFSWPFFIFYLKMTTNFRYVSYLWSHHQVYFLLNGKSELGSFLIITFSLKSTNLFDSDNLLTP